MAETSKDVEESYLQGLSVIDSVNITAVSNTTEKSDDILFKTEDATVAVKVDDRKAANNGEVTTSKAASFEEKLFVIDENPDESGIGESDYEKGLEAAEDEVTIVLDREDRSDIKDADDKDPNQTTLIITTEDLMESSIFDDTSVNIEEPEEKEEKKPSSVEPSNQELKKTCVKIRPKRDDHNYFWVSNISRHVKATDLKKFFSQIGKVLTAKILTNGKNYFGYVSMDSAESAAKCIKQQNNTTFDGKKIVVSKDRPDLREAKTSAIKVELRKKRVEKAEPKKEEKTPEPKTIPAEVRERKAADEHHTKCNSIIGDLRKKLDRCKSDVSRYKWKVLEFQRRHEGMRKKCDSLERELKEMQFKMRNERRRLNQDREQFEKNKKLEQIRFDADKAIINKELDEVKKLREHLKEKIEEFKAQTKKVPKRRSRSPAIRGRNLHGRSPVMRNNSVNNAFRSEERIEKKRKREDLSRGRTPPPPPKLSDVVGKKRGDRGPDGSVPNRPYFGDVEKRPPSLPREYDYRHKPSYASQEEVRGAWPTPFPKDPRRVGTGPSSSQSYPPDIRYGGGYQFPPSSISGPPRSYYPEFGKPYGSY